MPKFVDVTDIGSARSYLQVAHSITPEQFGADGDGSDDSAAISAMLAYAAANAGTSIYLAAGKTYGIATTAFVIPSYTHVWGGGTVKCLQNTPGGRGIIVIPDNGAHDIIWDGPTIDGNFTLNANCIGAGAMNDTYDFHENLFFRCIVKNARVDTALAESQDQFLSGGGKGFSIQGRCRNVYAQIVAINCDIGATVEAGTTSDRFTPNIHLDLISDSSRRTPLALIGSTPTGYGSLVSASFEHGHLPGAKINLIAYNGNTSTIIDWNDGNAEKDNHEFFGVVTSVQGAACEINAHVAVQAKATLIRGKMFGSKVTMTAYMDDLQDVWDARDIPAQGTIATNQLDNVIDVDVHTQTHSNVLITPPATGEIRRGSIDVDIWCENGVGNIMAASDDLGERTAYRFRDLTNSPIIEIIGDSDTDPSPAWSLADDAGRALVSRQTNPYLAHDEVPTVLGVGGVAKRWMHWDDTNEVLRLASSSPASETSGSALSSWTAAAVADGDTTPTVRNRSVIYTSNSAPTTITALDNGIIGQVVAIRFGDSNTTISHSSTLRLAGATSKTFSSADTVMFACHTANTWTEVSRTSTTGSAFLTGSATLNFGSVSAQSYLDLTITVTGAVTGDVVALATPTASITAGIAFTAWVSASDTVTVRAHNYTAGALDPASGSFKAAIIR